MIRSLRAAGSLGVAAILAVSPLASIASTDTSSTERPRIGLVLGGGGAKGMAHIGVLRVLDELRIPIDCVAGTSMGALVGAVFAGGMPPEQLEREALAIDWGKTVGSEGARDQVPIARKLARKTYTNSFEFGFKDGSLKSSAGLIGTQRIEDVIRGLVNQARFQRDFDDLPIPFRAIATDMVAGEMVVIDSGDIAVAMRASMALPGIFSPVIDGDRVLSDGGLMRNLPVDVARELCADVVIAVWLTNPPPKPEDFGSALAVLSRTTGVMIDANEREQVATLTDRDVGIEVPMGDITTGDFERSPDAVGLGRRAAQAMSASLQRYSVPEAEYLAWQTSVTTQDRPSVQLADVRVIGLERVNPDYVQAQLRDVQVGAAVTDEDINAAMNRIYALGDFQSVEYKFSGPPEARILEIRPVEKSWGPNFIRADAGLAAQGKGELLAILRVDHDRTWVTRNGGRWHNVGQIGRQTILSTDFYQPFDARQRFFVQPILRFESNLQDVYVDRDRVAQYFLKETYAKADIGMNIDTRAQVRAGTRYGVIDSDRDTGTDLLPDVDREREATVYLQGFYDTRDNIRLPTRGGYASARYVNSDTWLDAEQDYSLGEIVFTQAFPLRSDSLNFVIGGGKRFTGVLPPTRDFRLGGIQSFPGLQLDELRGDSYWVAGGNYRWRLADILSLFNQAIYGGLRLQAGRVGGRRDDVQDGTIYGASGNLSGVTPIGPFQLSLGYASPDSWALQFALGAPLPEGSALDQIN